MASFEPCRDSYRIVSLEVLPYMRALSCSNWAVLRDMQQQDAVDGRRPFRRRQTGWDALETDQAAARRFQEELRGGGVVACERHEQPAGWRRVADDCERLLAEVEPWSYDNVALAVAALNGSSEHRGLIRAMFTDPIKWMPEPRGSTAPPGWRGTVGSGQHRICRARSQGAGRIMVAAPDWEDATHEQDITGDEPAD